MIPASLLQFVENFIAWEVVGGHAQPHELKKEKEVEVVVQNESRDQWFPTVYKQI